MRRDGKRTTTLAVHYAVLQDGFLEVHDGKNLVRIAMTPSAAGYLAGLLWQVHKNAKDKVDALERALRSP